MLNCEVLWVVAEWWVRSHYLDLGWFLSYLSYWEWKSDSLIWEILVFNCKFMLKFGETERLLIWWEFIPPTYLPSFFLIWESQVFFEISSAYFIFKPCLYATFKSFKLSLSSTSTLTPLSLKLLTISWLWILSKHLIFTEAASV